MIFLDMALLIPAAVILCLVIVNMAAWPGVGRQGHPEAAPVSILIPARNEEDHLGACLDAALRQSVNEILVYDDHSSDGTARVIADYAARDARVCRIEPRPLPEGWCGKTFACAQLAEAASGEWMLFLDADARLTDGAVARMLYEAQTRGVTFLSCWPGLVCKGLWERALMPMLNFCVFTAFPAPLSFIRRDPNLGLAHGACILVHRETYRRVGGHGAVRDRIFEDTSLARHWREAGEQGLCLEGRSVVTVRMYDSLSGIWHGFLKNFYPAFRRDTSFWLFLLFHAWCFLAPFITAPVLLALGHTPIPALAAAACVIAMRAAMAIRFRYAWWSPLLHPLAQVLFIALGLSSRAQYRRGGGVEWKGRRYAPDGSARDGEAQG